MPTIPKEVNFADGEGLTHADLNLMQRLPQLLLCDGLLNTWPLEPEYPQLRSNIGSILAFGHSAAVYRGAGAREVRLVEGLFLFPQALTVDGATQRLLPYYLTEAEVGGLTRAAAVSSPRWDLLTVQVAAHSAGEAETRDFEDAATRALTSSSTNKRFRTTATFTWTQGAESATPVMPATPAGHKAICAVKVTPAMTLFDPTNMEMYDWRVPLGFNTFVRAMADDWFLTINGATAVGSATLGNLLATTGGGTERVDIVRPCPIASPYHRLRQFMVHTDVDVVTNHELSLVSLNLTGGEDLLWPAMNAGGTAESFYPYFNNDVPVWGNGYTAGYATREAGALARRMRVKHVISGSESAVTVSDIQWQFHGP